MNNSSNATNSNEQPSTRPMDCINDASVVLSQARAMLDTIIDRNNESDSTDIDSDALYGVRTLMDMARDRLCNAHGSLSDIARRAAELE